MRLPTFYEQNLIPNWGKVLLVRLLSDVCVTCCNTTFNVGRNPIRQKRTPQLVAADGQQE